MKRDKIKTIFLILITMCIITCPIALAESCEGLLTQEAADLLSDIIGYIRIGVPILLMILCAGDFVSVITSQDDNAMKKAGGRIVKRFIAAAAVFFVPLIISVILNIDAVKNSLNLVDDPMCGIEENTD